MKKLLLCAVITVLGLTSVSAQERAVKVNPLALLGGTDLVSFETKLGEQSTGVVGAAIGGFKFGGIKYSSFGGELQYRYYFGDLLDGWYGAAGVSYQSGTTEFETIGFDSSSSDEFDFSAFGGGLKIGHQWAWDSGFVIDLNLGASYKSFNYDFGDADSFTQELFKGSGVLPTFGFGVGYSW
ncbi:DUF3575 domain-containing protein [Flavobacteriaceae bacterium MHTCC 0001]